MFWSALIRGLESTLKMFGGRPWALGIFLFSLAPFVFSFGGGDSREMTDETVASLFIATVIFAAFWGYNACATPYRIERDRRKTLDVELAEALQQIQSFETLQTLANELEALSDSMHALSVEYEIAREKSAEAARLAASNRFKGYFTRIETAHTRLNGVGVPTLDTFDKRTAPRLEEYFRHVFPALRSNDLDLAKRYAVAWLAEFDKQGKPAGDQS